MDIPNQNPRNTITRTLSEEYFSRSPNSRLIIKSMAQATPTSKGKKEYTNVDEYTMASEEKKEFMIMYQMIPESVILAEAKKNKNKKQ